MRGRIGGYTGGFGAVAGRMVLTDEEAATLRQYLLSGGFIMADDFWGDDETCFDRFSEPMAYPMLINILVYTMAH